MSINNSLAPVMIKEYEVILSKFPVSYQLPLRIYTFEELYYCYRLAQHKLAVDKNGDTKSGDVFYSAMKKKLFSYLKGDRDKYGRVALPIDGLAFEKIGSKWKHDYSIYIQELLAERTETSIKSLEERVA